MPQVVEDFAQERTAERSVVSMSPKTKKATRRNKQGDGVDDGDDDAMLDEARNLLDVQLAELKAVRKEGDPLI